MKKNLSYLIDGKISTYQVFQPYDPVLCDFSDTLSKTLRSLKETKKYPDILTFAFWCRRANIKRLKRNFNSSEKRLGKKRYPSLSKRLRCSCVSLIFLFFILKCFYKKNNNTK